MIRTIIITGAVTAAACTAVLIAQSRNNQQLRESVEEKQAEITRLERDSFVVPGGRVTALPVGTARPGTKEAAVARLRATTTAGERIETTLSRIDRLVEELEASSISDQELFRSLPDLLRLIEDLSVEEMIAVAGRLDASVTSGRPEPKQLMKMVLLMLAAEQDPARILRKKELMDSNEMRGAVLGSLARRDPEAARRWLQQSDLPEMERDRYSMLLVVHALRQDFGAGMKAIREMGKKGSQVMQELAGLPISNQMLPGLVAALEDPENAAYRPQLVQIALGGATFHGGIQAARERAERMELTREEVSRYLESISGNWSEPQAAERLEWMIDVQDEETLRQTVPKQIAIWAAQNFNAAGEWLGGMEPSPLKDSSMATYAKTVSPIDPRAATIWAAEIGDEGTRTETLRKTMAQWRQKAPEELAQWLEENGIEDPNQP